MTPTPPTPLSPASGEVTEIERHFNRLTLHSGRMRRHEQLMAASGVTLDRAAVGILRHLSSDPSPQRPGVLAARLSVEASHVTRQLGQLEKAGYLIRTPDPDDRRAQRVHLTEAGLSAAQRVREVSRRSIAQALAEWSPEDRERLAALFGRMVSDFLAHAETEIQGF
ncbi:MarR family winged helix-turn-helix transcriptional regulator [Streptomyces acidiscabies]|uniref:MarR family winged helix-turn-helix transcriptional regulator n=1 Tax=Streptomyces acidiscabies TaxID=42234 RepID=UPI0038F69183